MQIVFGLPHSGLCRTGLPVPLLQAKKTKTVTFYHEEKYNIKQNKNEIKSCRYIPDKPQASKD